jgi:hypothetical protein
MTLSAHTHLTPLRSFRPVNVHRKRAAGPTVLAETVIPSPSTLAAHAQHILMVEFTSPDGRAWQGIGGGNTLADAIAFAQDSCPNEGTWQASSWSDLYGD